MVWEVGRVSVINQGFNSFDQVAIAIATTTAARNVDDEMWQVSDEIWMILFRTFTLRIHPCTPPLISHVLSIIF